MNKSLRCNLSSNIKKRNLSEGSKRSNSAQKLNVLNNSKISKHSDYNNFENENTTDDDESKIKKEAKELIDKTRKMMEDLSLVKIENFKKGNNKKSNNLANINYQNNISSNLNEDSSQKLILKNKQIKLLERELKEKTNQLKIAQEKLNSKNEEIKKINEALTNERSNNLRADNIKLQRKIFALEKANEENKKTYEKMIDDFKNKINNANNKNNENLNEIKEIQRKNHLLEEDNRKLQKIINEKTNLSNQLKEKNDIEKKVNEKKDIEIEDLKMNLSNLIVILKTLFAKECDFYDKRKNFLDNFDNIITENQFNNLLGSTFSSSQSNMNLGYDREKMNDNNINDIFKHK